MLVAVLLSSSFFNLYTWALLGEHPMLWPIFNFCPMVRLKWNSEGASNTNTIVEPILNSPKGSPFLRVTILPKHLSRETFCFSFHLFVCNVLSMYTLMLPTLVAPRSRINLRHFTEPINLHKKSLSHSNIFCP